MTGNTPEARARLRLGDLGRAMGLGRQDPAMQRAIADAAWRLIEMAIPKPGQGAIPRDLSKLKGGLEPVREGVWDVFVRGIDDRTGEPLEGMGRVIVDAVAQGFEQLTFQELTADGWVTRSQRLVLPPGPAPVDGYVLHVGGRTVRISSIVDQDSRLSWHAREETPADS